MHKKGNLTDIPEALSILFVVFMAFFIIYTINLEFNIRFDSNAITNSSTEAMEFYDKYTSRFNNSLDVAFMLLLIFFPIFSFIAAKKIPVDNTTFIITVFFMAFFLLASMIVSNIYGKMLEVARISDFVSTLTMIPFFMPKLLYYAIFYIMVVSIALYSKAGEPLQ